MDMNYGHVLLTCTINMYCTRTDAILINNYQVLISCNNYLKLLFLQLI